MSKNKFRALILLMLVSYGPTRIDLYSGTPDGFFTAVIQLCDIVLNVIIIILYILALVYGISYAIKAFQEDEPDEETLTKN